MYLVKLMFKFTQGSKGFDPGAEGGLGGRGGERGHEAIHCNGCEYSF